MIESLSKFFDLEKPDKRLLFYSFIQDSKDSLTNYKSLILQRLLNNLDSTVLGGWLET